MRFTEATLLGTVWSNTGGHSCCGYCGRGSGRGASKEGKLCTSRSSSCSHEYKCDCVHAIAVSRTAPLIEASPKLTFYRPADVMVDSPLNVISYDRGGNGSAASRQSFRLFYQSAIGNIKEAASDGLTAWQSARYALYSQLDAGAIF